MSSPPPPVTIHAIMASQYTAKVLLALDTFDIPHRVEFAHVKPSKRRLPGGGVLVPVLECGDETVTDSENILRWLDTHRGAMCFPPGGEGEATAAAADVSERVSEGFIGAAVLYYNWVDPAGYARSIRTKLKKVVPWFLR